MRDSLTRRTATEQPVRSYIGCDAHRRHSVFVSVDENGRASQPTRVEHAGNALAEYLASLPAEVDIAVEASGSWYWMIDAIEEADKTPHLAQAFATRRMLGGAIRRIGSTRVRRPRYYGMEHFRKSGCLKPGCKTCAA